MRRYYAVQYDTTWSLTAAAMRVLLETGVRDEIWRRSHE